MGAEPAPARRPHTPTRVPTTRGIRDRPGLTAEKRIVSVVYPSVSEARPARIRLISTAPTVSITALTSEDSQTATAPG